MLNGSAINGHGPVIDHADAPALTDSVQSEAPET